MSNSPLESRFALLWRKVAGPPLVREHKFCDGRRWRFDFANVIAKVAVEIEGGTWVKGRHTSGMGFRRDCEKYNAASEAGWIVYRLTTDMLTLAEACRIANVTAKRLAEQCVN